MNFIKKHYEKILLGIVLLGMVGGLLFLPLLIERDREQMENASRSIISRPAKPLP